MPVFTGTTYDRIKLFVQIVLPALATLVITVGGIWGLGFVEEVAATITAITVFLGVALGISSGKYYNSDRPYDGTLLVQRSPESGVTLNADLRQAGSDILDKDRVTLRVTRSFMPPEDSLQLDGEQIALPHDQST